MIYTDFHRNLNFEHQAIIKKKLIALIAIFIEPLSLISDEPCVRFPSMSTEPKQLKKKTF